MSREYRLDEQQIGGLRYAVHRWPGSNKQPLVLLHGFADCGMSYGPLVQQLNPDWSIVAPDWRGFGDTEWSESGYWFPDYLKDLYELLKIYCPDAAVSLIGHSMGSNIACLYAGIYPDSVKNVVAIEGFGLTDADPDGAAKRYKSWIDGLDGLHPRAPSDKNALRKRLRRSHGRLSEPVIESLLDRWTREVDGGVVFKADHRHRLPNPVLYRRAEAQACWRRITASVLSVEGAESNLQTAAADFLAHVEREAASVEHCVIPDAGHMVHLEQPIELATRITEFLENRL